MHSLQPFAYDTLILIHVLSFAIWLGLVLASFIVIRVLEPKLTDARADIPAFQGILQSYIKGETKFIDFTFPTLLISGLLLAGFFTGWNYWVFTKIVLVVLQFAATIGFIFSRIRKIEYPCSRKMYKKWYMLVGISLTFFTINILFVYFGR